MLVLLIIFCWIWLTLVWLSSTLWRELENNNLKITNKEFNVNGSETQPAFFIVLHNLLYFLNNKPYNPFYFIVITNFLYLQISFEHWVTKFTIEFIGRWLRVKFSYLYYYLLCIRWTKHCVRWYALKFF